MRRYETIVILDPDIASDARQASIDLVQDVIQRMDGMLVEIDDWGVRKLAYEIRKKPRGDYLRFDFCGMGPLVDEMERLFRINDQYLKFMTVLLDNDVDIEALKAELAEQEAAAQAAAEEKAAAAAAAAQAAEEKAAEAAAKAAQAEAAQEAPADETQSPAPAAEENKED